MIDDATTDQDLRVPPSNHFNARISVPLDPRQRQWRLIFRGRSRGEAEGVYLDDHSYR